MATFEQIARIYLDIKRKNQFVIPAPRAGESEDEFMGRCISKISGEYPEDQAVAICIQKWKEK